MTTPIVMVPLAATLVILAIVTIASSSFIPLSISTPHLRTIITRDSGVISLISLTLYDFYLMSDDRVGYIDGGSKYILTLHTNEIIPFF